MTATDLPDNMWADGLPPTQRGYGSRIDGHKIMWWGRKADAAIGAKAIRWPAHTIATVHTRFQAGYALGDGWGRYLTRDAYLTLVAQWDPTAEATR